MKVRRILFLTFAVAGLTAAVGCIGTPPNATAGNGSHTVDSRPLSLHPFDRQRDTVGALRFKGGLVLRADDRRFGGFSALHISADGRTLEALSDRGYLLRANLMHDADGRLVGVNGGSLVELVGLDGRLIGGSKWSDAEAMAVLRNGQQDDGVLVAFEYHHRLWFYPADGGAPLPQDPPPMLNRAPQNGGIEALARLPDGRFVALTESLKVAGGVLGWIGQAGVWSALAYPVDGGYQPTDAATLPNGDLLVLERRFPPVGARLRRVAAADLKAGNRLAPVKIAEIQEPLAVDNMEGLAVRQAADGTVLVYLLSDDNYNLVQRTLLLMFELVE